MLFVGKERLKKGKEKVKFSHISFSFYTYGCFTCTYVYNICAPCVCLVPMEAKRCQILGTFVNHHTGGSSGKATNALNQ